MIIWDIYLEIETSKSLSMAIYVEWNAMWSHFISIRSFLGVVDSIGPSVKLSLYKWNK